VLDIALPDGDGISLIGELRRVAPGAEVLVFNASPSRMDLTRAVEAGASALLHKSAPIAAIVEAIRYLKEGKVLVEPQERATLLRLAREHREREDAKQRTLAQLTPRELEVIAGLARGWSDKEIADFLSIGTELVALETECLVTMLAPVVR
jgi:DNA-binding NarL/FixJ family response regulator